jgi:hypothetical protein
VEKALVAQRVANRLFATENAVDSAILSATQLMSGLMEARQELGLNAVLGTAAVTKCALAITALTDARKAVVDTHNQLNEVKLRLGVRTRMDGGTGPKGYADTELDIDDSTVVPHRRAS